MKLLTAFLIVFCCAGAALLSAQTAALSVQGILKKIDGSAVPDDIYTVRFALYDAEFAGNEIWFETLNNVETSGGAYNAILGVSGKPLDAPFNQPYYLSVKIGNSNQELLPRPRLTAAPYAMSLLGSENSIPGAGDIQVHGVAATHGITAGGNISGYGLNTVGNINVGGEAYIANTVHCEQGFLAKTGPMDNGLGPFHGYGFKNDGLTGYGSNGYGVASIWAGGGNMVNVTNSDVTINTLLKLPYGFARTYTANQPGQTESTTFNQMYIGSPIVNTYNLPVTNNYSLETSAVIKVGAIQAMSDRRVKKDFSLSNAAADLALLQRIRVTDYKYKDAIAKGNGAKKGVIAQELEQLVPEAVGLSTDVIPDIYTLAQSVRLEAGALCLTMEKPHDLKVGDKVRIMAGDHQEDLPVTAVASANAFSLGDWKHAAPDKVFVYGREVNDFHSVDYDYLFTLNISATQELVRKVEALEQEKAAFRAENSELRRMLEGLRADVDALKAMR